MERIPSKLGIKMLEVRDLSIEVGGKDLLHDININIPEGETHVLFGPNGSGKTSIIMAILGFKEYKITKGSIIFKGKDITQLPTHERAKMGIGISFQRPPSIPGLKTRKVVEICAKNSNGDVNVSELAKMLNLEKFLDRDLNIGFSGGEIKRSEILQLLAQDPDLVLLDEPESGVDLDNISLLGNMINHLLLKDKPCYERKKLEFKKSGLIITHTGHILDYVGSDKGYVLCEGTIQCQGNPRELLENIRKVGYEKCFECPI